MTRPTRTSILLLAIVAVVLAIDCEPKNGGQVALREYVADFFPVRPKPDTEPTWSVTVMAEGSYHAHIKARNEADRKGVKDRYVIVNRKDGKP